MNYFSYSLHSLLIHVSYPFTSHYNADPVLTVVLIQDLFFPSCSPKRLWCGGQTRYSSLGKLPPLCHVCQCDWDENVYCPLWLVRGCAWVWGNGYYPLVSVMPFRSYLFNLFLIEMTVFWSSLYRTNRVTTVPHSLFIVLPAYWPSHCSRDWGAHSPDHHVLGLGSCWHHTWSTVLKTVSNYLFHWCSSPLPLHCT